MNTRGTNRLKQDAVLGVFLFFLQASGHGETKRVVLVK